MVHRSSAAGGGAGVGRDLGWGPTGAIGAGGGDVLGLPTWAFPMDFLDKTEVCGSLFFVSAGDGDSTVLVVIFRYLVFPQLSVRTKRSSECHAAVLREILIN